MLPNFKNVLGSFKRGLAGFSTILRGSFKLKVGLTIFSLVAGVGILEPVINNYRLNGHSSISLGTYERLLPISIQHPLGTDYFGRDMLALVFTGLRYSLMIGFLAGGVATLIAVTIATIAGYKGGKLDAVLNSVTNATLVIPALPILMAITFYVRINLTLLAITLAIFSWPWATRTIRAQILSMKERPYVDLAKVSGLRDFEIMFKEILPNLLPFIGVGFSYSVIGTILAETALRMIGLGPGEIPSLGLLLNWSMTFGAIAQGYLHFVLAPMFLLMLIFVSLNLINIGLEEAFNPRLKKITGL